MSQRNRIALVITELNVGGAERCLVNLATHLDRERFSPELYSLAPRPVGAQLQLVECLERAALPVHFLNLTSPWQVLSAVRQLRQQLARQQPAIVQTFLFHANVLGAWALRRSPQTRLVWGMRVADPSRWRQWLERLVCRRADRIACVSQAVADFCGAAGRLPPDKLSVIPNGLEVTAYPASRPADLSHLGVPAGQRVILGVGRLHPQKGWDWFLSRCAPALFRQLPRHDLLLVGEGPQRRELEVLTQTLGLAGRVHFAGWRPDVPQLLAASSLLVLPSRWEGLPNVVLEAMASGLPVLAAQTHGVLELLGPLADVQSVVPEDADGFVRHIVRILTEPTLAAELGSSNRQRAARQFSLDGMVQAYSQLYLALSAG